MKRILFVVTFFALVACSSEPSLAPMVPSQEELSRDFSSRDRELFAAPPKVHYPQTWFHYIGGNVSLEGITADLEAIADAGISGIQLFHGQFGGKWPETGEEVTCLSEKWDDAVKYTADECKRLGLNFTMQNCPGWAMSGGPWIKPENAMRTIIYSRVDAKGDNIETLLPMPQPSGEEWRDYRDIAVLAFPTPAGDTGSALELRSVKGDGDYPWSEVMTSSKRASLRAVKADGPHWVEMRLKQPSVIRSIVFPGVQSLNHNMSFEPGIHVVAYAVKADGSQHKIIDADLPMASWQDDKPLTFACPEVDDVVMCRLEINNQFNINMGRVSLYSAARKNSWESEAGWTLRAFERTADDVVQSSEAYLSTDDVIDVSKYMSADGRLSWKAPNDKEWTILRVGHVNEGKKNAPAPPAGTGWECDKLSTEGPEAHYAGYIGRLVNGGVLQGGALQGLLLDSWECRTQMWTQNMEQEFAERSGYDLRKWMPALLGYVVDSPSVTSRFLLDWRRVVGDLFANKFYRRMSELGRENGLAIMYETAAGDVFPADIMEYFKYADVPMCEFWHPFSQGYVGSLNFKPVKPTAAAARLYGKPRVAAESFTSFSLTWDEHLEMLKEYADYHFVEGVTYNVFHTYTHNPQIDFLKPGTSFGSNIGTPFLRGQTWWPYMKEFTTYLARCSYMLERGRSVSDVLWYLGDEISHKPDQLYPFPAGYKYDYCNPDVLVNRLKVEDGKIVTPEGLSYRMMWIPDTKRMLPETLEALQSLIEQGAVVVADAPESIATLRDAESAQKRFAAAVDAIWGNVKAGEFVSVGKGKVLTGVGIDEAIKMLEIPADVVGDVRWLHRKAKGADWYFVTPQKQKSFNGEVKFCATGRVQLWNPVTGEIEPIASSCDGEYTTVKLNLAQAGSCFVVFETNKKAREVAAPAELKSSLALNNLWSVEFPDGWDAPAKIETEELKPWKDMIESQEGKSFSGTATYTTSFNFEGAKRGEQVVLDLGKVDMIAEVTLNGEKVRTLWCAPYSVDISDYVRKGENSLTIEVTSTWFNRLVYDAAQPEEARKTWTINGPSANNALRNTGLMGPVVVKY